MHRVLSGRRASKTLAAVHPSTARLALRPKRRSRDTVSRLAPDRMTFPYATPERSKSLGHTLAGSPPGHLRHPRRRAPVSPRSTASDGSAISTPMHHRWQGWPSIPPTARLAGTRPRQEAGTWSTPRTASHRLGSRLGSDLGGPGRNRERTREPNRERPARQSRP
jgi:hypothetical protein